MFYQTSYTAACFESYVVFFRPLKYEGWNFNSGNYLFTTV